jgi:flagellar biosynthesis/type III secretory pathway protein FliH
VRAALALLVTLALPPAALAADVFRCVENGVTTYQDFPCRTPDGGQVVRVVVPDSPPPSANAQESADEARKRLDAAMRERRQREITAEIERIEQSIARIEREEAAELDVLRNQRGFAANNFKADGWDRARVDRAMVDEMAAVSAKYRARTEPLRRRIIELRNEQKTLTAARQ